MTAFSGKPWFQSIRKNCGYKTHLEIAKLAVRSGAALIIMAEENFGDEEYMEEALKVKRFCDENEVLFLTFDNTTAAFVVNAAGVYLYKNGSETRKARELLGPGALVAVHVKNEAEAAAYVESGASCLVAGNAVHKIVELGLPVVRACEDHIPGASARLIHTLEKS